ncbi:C-1-tetrahydrofolate synthase, cytoplasmic [Dermacentor andersoni]|uniref:C-1-tetrahydrofolate synthase, cytoplasmic n=1 Tax=Dermacentor andersoni TaxID=34620 RepID=UPI002155037B|nr:C-1-tetrahydrofolate synthase, cytoplasmic-like [Dermacentor andersoni]
MSSAPGEATVLSGRQIAKEIREKLAAEVKAIKVKHPEFRPMLAIVQVGGREDSNVYIRMKRRAAEEVGAESQHIKFPRTITEEELVKEVETLNNDPTIHGIIVQLPLDCDTNIDSNRITNAVSPEKDVDGIHDQNAGRLAHGELEGFFIPCTPRGCLELIKRSGVPIVGARATVLGRSKIVGSPMSSLLLWNHATVTTCHSKTKDLPSVCREADILVVAIGRPRMVKAEWVKPGAVVIDCGINAIPDATRSSGTRLVGDVDFDEVKKVASYITPVPEGVGPMTVAMLISNTVESAKRCLKASLKVTNSSWSMRYLPLSRQTPVPSDLDIAFAQKPKLVDELAREMGLEPQEWEPHGRHKAKLLLPLLNKQGADGHYVLVTGVNPTPLGEGKSTTSVGLCQALGAHRGRNAIACLRQPSQGPTFGIKGGAAGGGYAQVIPMDDLNLHLTGDMHAVTAANNLLAAQLDARVLHESTQQDAALFARLVTPRKGDKCFSDSQRRRLAKLGLPVDAQPEELSAEQARRFARLDVDVDSITWNRVMDTNDRFLRRITIGQGPAESKVARQTQFDITPASEVMAVLALARDMEDLRDRLRSIVVASDRQGNPVTADDLGAAGAMLVLLKEAACPTLLQTLEGTPVLIHCGPFANIAHGNSSVIADRMALKLVGPNGYVVTEGGFGADNGMEKFVDIKCRASGLSPSAVVIVATVRALKVHGGGPPIALGAPLPAQYSSEDVSLVRSGFCNLARHIENAAKLGLPAVVAINAFSTDTAAELELVREMSLTAGAQGAVVCRHWELGGEGAVDLARAVEDACAKPRPQLRFAYDLSLNIESKLEAVARTIYGARCVELSALAKTQAEHFERQGYGKMAVCIAKTPLSLSHDPKLLGSPRDFVLPVRELRLSAGAGFIYALAGDVTTMPGLPTRPALMDVDLDVTTGRPIGLF